MLKRHLQNLCPLYSCIIQSPPYNPPLESKKCMPTFELDIGEQMCQAKVFVCEFTAEDFEEVSHIPSCSVHIVMNFTFANIRWFFMNHYFLDNESHTWKKMAAIIIVIFICTFTYHFYRQHSGLDFFKK